jgi:hypothetical protein
MTSQWNGPPQPVTGISQLFFTFILYQGFFQSLIDVLVALFAMFSLDVIFSSLCTCLDYLRYEFSNCYGLCTELLVPVCTCKLRTKYIFSLANER